MNRLKIFISSVQSEFASERQMLFDYITSDPLLGRFFDVFIFEKLPAKDKKASDAYLDEVRQSDIYLGIFGKKYGFEDKEGISPTEREFDLASAERKTRLIFITDHKSDERHPKELALIKKAEDTVVRNRFSDPSELKTAVYAALVEFLEEKEFIRTGPFDASICKEAVFDDIDSERIRWFVEAARRKRGFPLSPDDRVEKILTQLHLIKTGKLTNAAVLLFGKEPQRFFISSEVRCVLFHGNEIHKPIPSYQVYKGDVFQLVDQAVDFVLSRIDVYVGDRSQSVDVDVKYEIPRSAVTEAIVNAVAHRDYTSTGSVQVMVFRNRVEVWNPGRLPNQLTLADLKKDHESFPANPLIAEPLFYAGYIERIGTGISDMVKNCLEAGLTEPEFQQEASFKAILWRKAEATEQVTGEVTGEVERILFVIRGEMKRSEIQKALDLRHDDYFRLNYILPALESGCIEMTFPDNPNHPKQKYRLTAKGKALQQQLKMKKE
jgi:hypothetical protein